jgi:hypothetical protein
MSNGLRRVYNVQSNIDPLWYAIKQNWYLPRHHRIFKTLYECDVCGKPTLTNKPCSNRCKKGVLINVPIISSYSIRGTESHTA